MKKVFPISVCMIIFFILGCVDSPKPMKNYPDPYWSSFRSGAFRYVLKMDSILNDVPDTTFIKDLGLSIYEKDKYSETRYEFDSLGFIMRYYHLSDIGQNFKIEYEYGKDRIVQKWRAIDNRDWSTENFKFMESQNYDVVLKLKNGFVMEELNEARNRLIKYSYDPRGKVLRKEILSLRDGSTKRTIDFTYKLDKIKMIEYSQEGSVFRTDHFGSIGLVDSIIVNDVSIYYSYIK